MKFFFGIIILYNNDCSCILVFSFPKQLIKNIVNKYFPDFFPKYMLHFNFNMKYLNLVIYL